MPTALSIIKDINRHFKIGLSYGRFSSFRSRKSFLIYTNTAEQFDRLMVIGAWPLAICDTNYSLDLPAKTPTAYSIVVSQVPTQWNIENFKNDIKKQYPTTLKIERLFVKGAKPIPKVRIDFSTNKELTDILKNKRLLFDDAHTSLAVEQYVPQTKILRCYVCQQYNDHTALNCPHKEKPICFRCGQSHSHNPKCTNKICCAHCEGEHMAGNPSCPREVEERRKRNEEIKSKNTNSQQVRVLARPSAWTTKSHENLSSAYAPMPASLQKSTGNDDELKSTDIASKLDLLMAKVIEISTEQSKLSSNVANLYANIQACQQEVDLVQGFVL